MLWRRSTLTPMLPSWTRSLLSDKAKWDAAEQNAKDYADSLASDYDAAGSAAEALADAKEYTDTALTWGSF